MSVNQPPEIRCSTCGGTFRGYHSCKGAKSHGIADPKRDFKFLDLDGERRELHRLRAENQQLLAELDGLRQDKERLDWLDTLPSGISILGDAKHPEQCCTPKKPGFSHTRWLIDDNRASRSLPGALKEEKDAAQD